MVRWHGTGAVHQGTVLSAGSPCDPKTKGDAGASAREKNLPTDTSLVSQHVATGFEMWIHDVEKR